MTDFSDDMLESVIGHVKEKRDRYHMGKMLFETLKKFANKVNQVNINTGQSETNGSVLERASKLAIWLIRNGIKQGDVIAVWAPNHADTCVTLVASLFIGATVMPTDIALNYLDLKNMIEMGEPKMIFCENTNSVRQLQQSLELTNLQPGIVTYDAQLVPNCHNLNEIMKITNIPNNFRPLNFDPATTTAFIFSTSGTTGKPKGVVITQKSFLVRLCDFWFPDKHAFDDERFLCFSPIHWITGAAITMTCCIFGASRIFSTKPFDVPTAHKMVTQFKPTITLCSPIAAVSLVTHENSKKINWSSLRTVFVAGAPITLDAYHQIQKILVNSKITVCYGLTEAAGALATHPLDKSTTIIPMGKIRPTIQAKVVDSIGNKCGVNETGELLFKSEDIFSKYLNNPKATEEAFDDDGWFKTGDLVYYDENEVFYYFDRLKILIKYSNQQISPGELEAVIAKHPAVGMVAVGKIKKDLNELPAALIVKKPLSSVSAEDIKNLVAKNLSSFKQLHGGLAFVDSLPLTSTGKIDRKAVQDLIPHVTFI